MSSTDTPPLVTVEIDADLRFTSPMFMTRHNISWAHTIITGLIQRAESKFKVTTEVNSDNFDSFLAKTRAEYEGTVGNQVNRETMRDIKEWVEKAGDYYSACFVTPEIFEDDTTLYNTVDMESLSIKSALEADNCNLVIYSPNEKSSLKRSDIDALRDEDARKDARRTPCKRRGGLLGKDNLHFKKKYIDLQKVGLGQNQFVPEKDFLELLDSEESIYAMIPSYEVYEDLASDSALSGQNMVGAMHCASGGNVKYRMSLLFPCGKSKDLSWGAKTCVTNSRLYKMQRITDKKCQWPWTEGVGLDKTCCVINSDEWYITNIMHMYDRRRSSDIKGYEFLGNIHKSFVDFNGNLKAYDSRVSIYYPTEPNTSDNEQFKVFQALKPSVKRLSLVGPQPTLVPSSQWYAKRDSFSGWYDKVNAEFSLKSRFEVALYYQYDPRENLSNRRDRAKRSRELKPLDNPEHFGEVIAHSPKSFLLLDIDFPFPIDVSRGIRAILQAMYEKESFYFEIKWKMSDTTGQNPTRVVRELSFIENLGQREESPNPHDPEFDNKYVFIREHVHLRLRFTKYFVEMGVTVTHKFS